MRTITKWARGAFATVEMPDWWESELDRNWAVTGDKRDRSFHVGEDHGAAVVVFDLGDARGFLIDLDTYERCFTILAETEADLLDFLTSRAARWTNLGEGRPIAESLDHIRNALVSIARWGVDTRDVDKWSGVHKRDAI